MTVDLGRLEEVADGERARLTERLSTTATGSALALIPARLCGTCWRTTPTTKASTPRPASCSRSSARSRPSEGSCPSSGGPASSGPAPTSRRYVVAMMSWTGPYEAEAPAWFYVNPPDPSWVDETKDQWRSLFSATTLPAITAHEVTPGHFAHGRMIRLTARGDVRRSLASVAFVEGWAHYAEELLVEEGFREEDPRFRDRGVDRGARAGHTTRRRARGAPRHDVGRGGDGPLPGGCLFGTARGRVRGAPATFDPTYGRYTWGKLEIQALRNEAIARWGPRFGLRRFHEALLELGAPPLGTIGDTGAALSSS